MSLREGDRVHWPEDPDDTGTVVGPAGALVVVWDREPDVAPEDLDPDEPAARDVNEVDEDGLVTDLLEGPRVIRFGALSDTQPAFPWDGRA
jgi:hypothetical protein